MVRSLADRLGAFLVRTPSPPVDEQWPLEACTSCKASLADEPLYLEQHVCPACRFHYPIAARERDRAAGRPRHVPGEPALHRIARPGRVVTDAAQARQAQDRPDGGGDHRPRFHRRRAGDSHRAGLSLPWRHTGRGHGREGCACLRDGHAPEAARGGRRHQRRRQDAGRRPLPDAACQDLCGRERPAPGRAALHLRACRPHHRPSLFRLCQHGRRHPGGARRSPGARSFQAAGRRRAEGSVIVGEHRRGTPGPRNDRQGRRQGALARSPRQATGHDGTER